MKGIECAFIGRVVRPLTERTSNEGHRWGHILLAVGTKDESELLSVSVFHDAVNAAAELKIGDRAYVEGRIRVRRYERDGESQTSLNVAAFTFEPVGRIGRKRPDCADDDASDATRTRAPVMANAEPDYRAHDDAPSSRTLRRENGGRSRGRRFHDFRDREG